MSSKTRRCAICGKPIDGVKCRKYCRDIKCLSRVYPPCVANPMAEEWKRRTEKASERPKEGSFNDSVKEYGKYIKATPYVSYGRWVAIRDGLIPS